MDRTMILVKPDAFRRQLTGEIIARFERKGLQLAALKLMTIDEEMAKHHYAEHVGKPFFDDLEGDAELLEDRPALRRAAR